MLQAGWSEFKALVDSKELSIQHIVIGSFYYLRLVDGSFCVDCVLPVDDSNEDTADFIANYREQGNKLTKANVIQVLGKDSLFLSPRGIKFTAIAGQSTAFDKELDAQLVLRGGILFAKDAVVGDSIKLWVIDKNNVVGMGGTPEDPTILGQYVDEWYVIPNTKNELVDVSISQSLPPGLFVRIEYISVGEADVSVILNLISYEIT